MSPVQVVSILLVLCWRPTLLLNLAHYHTFILKTSTSFLLAYLRTSVGRRAWAVPQKWGCSCESLSRLLRCTATPPSGQTSPGRTLARTEHTAPCRDRVENKTQYNFICWRKTQDLRRLYRLVPVSHFGSTQQLPVVESLRVMWYTGERQHVNTVQYF